MKKYSFLLALCFFSLIKTNAQVKIPANAGSIPKDLVNRNFTLDDVVFYPQPNYQGTPGKVIFSAGIFKFPFTNKKNISFVVASGKIAYFKFCYEVPYEQAYTGSVSNLDLSNLCGVRTDEIQSISLLFAGISTNIENNDCKKVFGNVSVKFKEIAPDGTECFLPLQQVIAGSDKFIFTPFSKANVNVANRYGNFVYSNNPLPDISTPVSITPNGRDECWLPIGKTAIRDGRVKMIITSNIKSAHKSGEVASDYSSNVHMERPVTEQIPINYLYNGDKLVNAESPRFFVGPYRATGSPDNKDIASGGIFKAFRAHFIIQGL